MKFKTLKLFNYRQYSGSHKINLLTDSKKSFNVILGGNGFGKSAAYRAINWCFFNKEPRMSNHPDSDTKLNFKVRDKIKIGSEEEVSVKIELERVLPDGNKDTVTVERTEYYKKISDKDDKNKTPSVAQRLNKSKVVVSYYDDEGFQELESDYAEQYIENKIIDEDRKNFYFFDGEDIIKFVDDNKSKKIKDTISLLTDLTDMNQVLQNLKNLRKDLVKKVPKSGGNNPESMLLDSKKKLIDMQNDAKKTLDQLKKNEKLCEDYEDEINKYRAIINKNSATKELMLERDNIDIQIANLREKIEEVDSGDRKNILTNFEYVLSHKILENLDDTIEEKIRNNELPPPIIENVDAVNTIIDNDKLIIDNDIMADIKWRSKINKDKFLERIALFNNESMTKRNSQMARLAMKTKEFSSNLLRQETDNVFNAVKNSHQKRKDYNNDLKVLDKQRISLTEKIGNFDQKIYLESMTQLRKYEDLLTDKTFAIGIQHGEIGNTQKIIKEEKIYILKKQRQLGTSSAIYSQLQFIEESIDLLEPTIEESSKSIKNDTSRKLDQNFSNLISQKNKFNASLKDNYAMSVIDKDNYQEHLPPKGKPLLSTGQQFLLGYSFKLAMQEGTGLYLPQIIDTPFSAVAKENRNEVVDAFINLSKTNENFQYTFFFTSSELTENIKSKLKNYISNSYEIRSDDNLNQESYFKEMR
jgi:DNA sulfur modification protein DndD